MHFVGTLQEGLDNESPANDSQNLSINSTALPNPISSSSESTGCSGVNLTNQNISFLNDRLNKMQVVLSDLSGNIQIINKQMEQIAQQNTQAAENLVGNEPFNFNDQNPTDETSGTEKENMNE